MGRASASRRRVSGLRAGGRPAASASCARRTGNSARPVQRAASSVRSSVSGGAPGRWTRTFSPSALARTKKLPSAASAIAGSAARSRWPGASRRPPALRPCSRAARVSSRRSIPPEAGAYSCASCAGSAAIPWKRSSSARHAIPVSAPRRDPRSRRRHPDRPTPPTELMLRMRETPPCTIPPNSMLLHSRNMPGHAGMPPITGTPGAELPPKTSVRASPCYPASAVAAAP